MTLLTKSEKPSFWRTAFALLMLVTCLRVWIGPTAIVPTAQAQIPDSGAQRKHILEEARRTNQLLVDITHILTTRTFNVRIDEADITRAPTKSGTSKRRRQAGS